MWEGEEKNMGQTTKDLNTFLVLSPRSLVPIDSILSGLTIQKRVFPLILIYAILCNANVQTPCNILLKLSVLAQLL